MKLICVLLFLLLISACYHKELRGKVYPSKDNNSYLIIEKNCGSDLKIRVDGKIWPYKLGEMGPIQPGAHTLTCGGDLKIIIESGTVYHFDYWGP